MIERKNNKRLHISVKDIENENSKEIFKKILPLIKEISDKKANDFQKSVKKNLRMMKTMNLKTYQ